MEKNQDPVPDKHPGSSALPRKDVKFTYLSFVMWKNMKYEGAVHPKDLKQFSYGHAWKNGQNENKSFLLFYEDGG